MTSNVLKSPLWVVITVFCLLAAPFSRAVAETETAAAVAETATAEAAPAEAAPKKAISNKRCMKCHGDEEEKTAVRPDGTEINIFVDKAVFEHSVHAKQLCVGCHNNIAELPHDEPLPKRVGCTQCHQEQWEKQKNNPNPEFKRLGVVIEQIDSYMHSVHAKPNKLDGTKVNATCVDCHEAHNIGTLGSEQRAEHRLKNPEVCGRCHEKQKTEYLTSVHGKALTEKKDAKTAVCSDCHTTHNIASPKADQMKLKITQNCGNCHEDAQKSYFASYHGQVNRLGYTNTAKCFDCHGGHGIKKVDDPTSSVHANNRLKTCNTCHKNAPENFLGFHAHGHANDFEKYPAIWITTKFMQALIIGVFLFFWTHVVLWFYREYKDRQEGKGYVHDPAHPETVYFRRFTMTWRVIHFLFAVSTMTLVMTGTTLLFSHTDWAKFVMDTIGGPKVEAIIHRTAATVWLSVFLAHFVIVAYKLWTNRKTFKWFGPTSMVPTMQDLRDVGAMFRWFFGKAPRPNFDRWSYWQKFDYWAPFWGAAIIGFSGMMLFFPTKTAIILPGWVFNIATIVHAEEALLATMFLFSVHFFNVHFRPDKFPMSTTIFTGAIPLEEFKHEHKLEYERLLASGELDKYLVKPPSARVAKGSKVLAATLIFAGLTLFSLVLMGYMTMS